MGLQDQVKRSVALRERGEVGRCAGDLHGERRLVDGIGFGGGHGSDGRVRLGGRGAAFGTAFIDEIGGGGGEFAGLLDDELALDQLVFDHACEHLDDALVGSADEGGLGVVVGGAGIRGPPEAGEELGQFGGGLDIDGLAGEGGVPIEGDIFMGVGSVGRGGIRGDGAGDGGGEDVAGGGWCGGGARGVGGHVDGEQVVGADVQGARGQNDGAADEGDALGAGLGDVNEGRAVGGDDVHVEVFADGVMANGAGADGGEALVGADAFVGVGRLEEFAEGEGGADGVAVGDFGEGGDGLVVVGAVDVVDELLEDDHAADILEGGAGAGAPEADGGIGAGVLGLDEVGEDAAAEALKGDGEVAVRGGAVGEGLDEFGGLLLVESGDILAKEDVADDVEEFGGAVFVFVGNGEGDDGFIVGGGDLVDAGELGIDGAFDGLGLSEAGVVELELHRAFFSDDAAADDAAGAHDFALGHGVADGGGLGGGAGGEAFDGAGNEDGAAAEGDGVGFHLGSGELEFGGPEQAIGEGSGLGVGEGGDDEVEGGAFAGEGGDDAADFDGGDLVGGEDAFGGDVLGALGVGASAHFVEAVEEQGADVGGHVAAAGVGEFGDHAEAFDDGGIGVGEGGVFGDGFVEGGIGVCADGVAGIGSGATAAGVLLHAAAGDGGDGHGQEGGHRETDDCAHTAHLHSPAKTQPQPRRTTTQAHG